MGNGAAGYNFIRQKSGLTAKAFVESPGPSKTMGCQIFRDLLKYSRAVLESDQGRVAACYHRV
jgi:lipopolysaccharide export system protein LptA